MEKSLCFQEDIRFPAHLCLVSKYVKVFVGAYLPRSLVAYTLWRSVTKH